MTRPLTTSIALECLSRLYVVPNRLAPLYPQPLTVKANILAYEMHHLFDKPSTNM